MTLIADSGKTCLVFSSRNWIVDSGATDHMTGNPHIFSNYQSQKVYSPIIIADGSTYNVEGIETVKPTPSTTLSSVLNLPSLAFNLISVSKLTNDLKCCISFFPDQCFFRIL